MRGWAILLACSYAPCHEPAPRWLDGDVPGDWTIRAGRADRLPVRVEAFGDTVRTDLFVTQEPWGDAFAFQEARVDLEPGRSRVVHLLATPRVPDRVLLQLGYGAAHGADCAPTGELGEVLVDVVAPALVLEPAVLDLGTVRLGERVTAALTVSAEDGGPVGLDALLSDVPGLSTTAEAPLDVGNGEARSFPLSFTPEVTGRHAGRIRLVVGSEGDAVELGAATFVADVVPAEPEG